MVRNTQQGRYLLSWRKSCPEISKTIDPGCTEATKIVLRDTVIASQGRHSVLRVLRTAIGERVEGRIIERTQVITQATGAIPITTSQYPGPLYDIEIITIGKNPDPQVPLPTVKEVHRNSGGVAGFLRVKRQGHTVGIRDIPINGDTNVRQLNGRISTLPRQVMGADAQ